MAHLLTIDTNNLGRLTGVIQGELNDLICKHNWLPAIFKDNTGKRIKSNWRYTKMLVYDIDSGTNLERAIETVTTAGLQSIIGTTKSYTTANHRFRVLLFCKDKINTEQDYKSTWQHYKNKFFPTADEACKDVTRFYFPCTRIVHEQGGQKLTTIEPTTQVQPVVTVELPQEIIGSTLKGDLLKRTLRFLVGGAKPGTWHDEFVRAAMDMRDNNYSYDEAFSKLEQVTGELDAEHDIVQLEWIYNQLINSAYTKIQGDTLAGGSDTAISTIDSFLSGMDSYLDDSNMLEGEPTGFDSLDRLMAGGLKRGELTALVAEAKTGKSTFMHQIMFNFVKRGVPVSYASREMRVDTEVLPALATLALGRNVLNEAAANKGENTELKLSIRNAIKDWPLMFSKGAGPFPIEQLRSWIVESVNRGVKYFFADHFHYMLNDPTDLKETTLLIQEIKRLVNEHQISLMCVIQPTKINLQYPVLSIKGGSAIEQACDNVFELRRLKTDDFVNELRIAKKRRFNVKTGSVNLHYDQDLNYLEEAVKRPTTHANPMASEGGDAADDCEETQGRRFQGLRNRQWRC